MKEDSIHLEVFQQNILIDFKSAGFKSCELVNEIHITNTAYSQYILQDGHIIKLALTRNVDEEYPNVPDNGIVTISNSILDLTNLKELYITILYSEDYGFELKLPENLNNLQHLEKLYIDTVLYDTYFLKRFHSLNSLTLKNAGIFSYDSEDIPRNINDNFFKNFRSLRVLDLSNNKITYIHDEIGNMRHLEELVLSKNSFVKLPESFKNLINLRVLDLRETPLSKSNDLPEILRNLTSLEQLYLPYIIGGTPHSIVRPGYYLDETDDNLLLNLTVSEKYILLSNDLKSPKEQLWIPKKAIRSHYAPLKNILQTFYIDTLAYGKIKFKKIYDVLKSLDIHQKLAIKSMVDINRVKSVYILSESGNVIGSKIIADNEVKPLYLYQNYKVLSKRYSNTETLQEQAFLQVVKTLDQLDFISITNGLKYQIDEESIIRYMLDELLDIFHSSRS